MSEIKEELSRRNFVKTAVAAGIGTAAVSATSAQAQAPAMEMNVNITTPDGVCDAAFIHPPTGAHAAVIIWPDAFGLRPSMRDMAKRLAAEGYSVLVPNPYYRVRKGVFVESAVNFNFNDPAQRGQLTPLMGSIGAAGAAEKDAAAFVAWLDTQSAVDRSKKIGTQGYCMGGPLIVRTAAALPDRIGAAASFHGGGLVTPAPDSPHKLVAKAKARMYFGVAQNDDMQQPTAKTELKAALDAARLPNEVEVYPAQHGWCVPDMPGGIYNRAEAEKAWGKLLALYKAGLA